MLAEPVTWGRRRPRWAMLVVAAQLIVAAGLITGSRIQGSDLRRLG